MLAAVKTKGAAVVCWPVEDQVLTGGCVAGSICPVQGCALMRSAGNVYSLMVGEQLLPKSCWAHFYVLAAPSSLFCYW
jgi:hypothetical protein